MDQTVKPLAHLRGRTAIGTGAGKGLGHACASDSFPRFQDELPPATKDKT